MNAILNVLNTPVVNSILIFLTTSALLYAFKPKLMFKENGEMKSFGYGNDKTCFTFPVVVFGTTLVGYIILKMLYTPSAQLREQELRGGGKYSSPPPQQFRHRGGYHGGYHEGHDDGGFNRGYERGYDGGYDGGYDRGYDENAFYRFGGD